jgi:energy-coupling factor transporter ATP-binding protein EcfA2
MGDVGLTAAEGRQIMDTLGLWHWRQARHAPRLLLGWLGCAVLAGALKWRPHLQLTAPPGAGKSTLFGLLQGLLGSSCLTVSASTEAAIRQMLGPRAPACLVDEIENDNPLRAKPIYELARLASTEGQADVARGSAEGRASTFPVRACFVFSSVLPPKLRPQDLARVMVLEFDAAAGGADESGEPVQLRVRREVEHLKSLGPALRRRMVDDFPRLLATIEVFERVIAEAAARARVADQVGVLLAAAHVLTADGVPEEGEAAALVAEFALPDLVGHEDEGGVNACLNHLLSSETAVEGAGGGTYQAALGALVARGSPAPREWRHQALKRCGLSLVRDEGGVDWLAVANGHRGLDRIFWGTPWQGGVWPTELRRMPGARASLDKLGFGGVQSRATLLPLASLDLDADEVRGGSMDRGEDVIEP